MSSGFTIPRFWPLLAVLIGLGIGAARSERQAPAVEARLHRRAALAAPSGFVYVPGGMGWMGSDDPDADVGVSSRHRVHVDGFYIGRTEVTNAEYQRFRPEQTYPPSRAQHPVTNITLEEARAYCAWAGGFIPSDAQWERAARGVDGRRYPWGDQWDDGRCNARVAPGQEHELQAVGSFLSGASPCGALDMAGNAWEWVADSFDGDPQRRVIRGGAHAYGERDSRTYSRSPEGAGVT